MTDFAKAAAVCLAAAALLAAGCKKTADSTLNYKSAINDWYATHPSCVWARPQKFPEQVTTSDTDKTRPFDALYDEGLLTRAAGDKKRLLGLLDKLVTTYDLSDKGRAAWTADPNQPGYGNFCYGHRSVANIESSTPNNGEPGATTLVNFYWSFTPSADWAKAQEVQTAFPNVGTNIGGTGAATKTLVDTPDGWKVQSPSGSATTPADGSVVE